MSLKVDFVLQCNIVYWFMVYGSLFYYRQVKWSMFSSLLPENLPRPFQEEKTYLV